MYKHILKPILFRFNPETAHNMIMSSLTLLRHIPFGRAILRSAYTKDYMHRVQHSKLSRLYNI